MEEARDFKSHRLVPRSLWWRQAERSGDTAICALILKKHSLKRAKDTPKRKKESRKPSLKLKTLAFLQIYLSSIRQSISNPSAVNLDPEE
jgi:hypothetical protein